MSRNNYPRILIEYRQINIDSMQRVEYLVYSNTEAGCWLLHDKTTWNAMLLVMAQKDKELNRNCFNRGALFNVLKQEGLGDYSRVAFNKIEKVIEDFIKRPDVVAINYSDDKQLEEMYSRIKDPMPGDKKQEDAILYKEIADEACDFIRAGQTLTDLYAKYRMNTPKSNLLIKHSMTFGNMWKNYQLLEQVKKSEYTFEESMQSYIDEHQDEVDNGTDYIKLISDVGHGDCLEAIYRIFIKRKDPKKNLVWLYGAPNSGKTTLIKHLETIFCCQEFNFQDKYCTLQDPSKSDCEVQIVTSKEFEVDHAFSMANYTSLKRMCEGIGAPVSNNKFVEFKQQFVGKQFIVASNKLPRCSFRYHNDHDDMWKPMLCRMEMVELLEGFDGTTAFPYTPVELAAALTQMINRDPEQDQAVSKDASQELAKSEDRIDLFDVIEKKQPEEAKQEETLTQAEKAGHMRSDVQQLPASQPSGMFIQSQIQQPRMILSQSVLGKRDTPEGGDLNSVVASLAVQKRHRH